MAVKKKSEEIKVEEMVKEPEVVVDSDIVSDTSVGETPEVSVETEEQPKVSVDVEGSVVKKEEQPERNVRIKMGADHKCCIGGEWYNLKKGQCYNVPTSVKTILMQVEGLLLPL